MFQRQLTLAGTASATAIGVAAVAAAMAFPLFVSTIIPLAVAVLMLALLWSHGRAQGSARRAEIVNSFAGLSVIHDGNAITIDEDPLVGEFDTRRRAARAAMLQDSWAVIVRAYDRYYVLLGHRAEQLATPVAFRTRAVADVVPAVGAVTDGLIA